MSSGFTGTWRIDLGASTVWNAETGLHEPDRVGDEIISLHDGDGRQVYEVLYGSTPRIRMGYECQYDDPEWVPYLVREIGNIGDRSEAEAVQDFAQSIRATAGTMKRSFEVGKAYSLARVVSGDELTHYRLGADPATGVLVYSMMRRMDEDGSGYTSHVFDVNGVVSRVRRFIRVPDYPPTD